MRRDPYWWKVPPFQTQFLYALTPSGCRDCQVPEQSHGRRWKAHCGWHAWERPTDRQIKARMRLRRKHMGAYRWRTR